MKSKELYILALGLLTALTPYLGLPSSWKTILYVTFGLLIAVLAFLLRRDITGSSRENDVFVENGIDDINITTHDASTDHAQADQENANIR